MESSSLLKNKEETEEYFSCVSAFNKNINEMNGKLSKFQYIFLQWLSNMNLLRRDFSANGVQDNAVISSLMDEYSNSQKIVHEFLVQKINDCSDFAELKDEMPTLFSLFNFFTDVSKLYVQFQPIIPVQLTTNYYKIINNVKKTYSKSVINISDKLKTDPSYILSLASLPSSFPTYKLAYAMLLSELIEIEKNAIFEEASLKAQCDSIIIRCACPPPKVVASHPMFITLQKLQQKIFNTLSSDSSDFLTEIRTLCENCTSIIVRLATTISEEIPRLEEERRKAVAASAEVTAQSKANQFLKQIQNEMRGSSFTGPLLDDCTGLTGEVSDDLQIELAKIDSLELIIEKHNKEIQSILEARERKIRSNECFARPPSTSGNDNDKNIEEMILYARDPIESCVRSITDALQSVSSMGSFSFLFVGEGGGLERMVEATAVRGVELKYYDSLIAELSRLVNEKEIAALEAETAGAKAAREAERGQKVLDDIKKSDEAPETSCPNCSVFRTHVLRGCGHSFCMSCMGEMGRQFPMRCKWCGMEFKPQDAIEIHW